MAKKPAPPVRPVAQPPHKTPSQLLADVALAHAMRRPHEPMATVTHTWNAKGDVQVISEVPHADPYEAWRISTDLLDLSMAKYPRSNGAA